MVERFRQYGYAVIGVSREALPTLWSGALQIGAAIRTLWSWIKGGSSWFMWLLIALWHPVADFLSGELFLEFRANGGGVISLRALWIAIWIWLPAVVAVYFLTYSAFHWEHARLVIVERLAWFGALFGASYAGLYARFASQWSYVAGVYNQIKAAEARSDPNTDKIAQWKAGYIEDAEDLHLATKPNVATTILIWLRDEKVRKAFIDDTPGNHKRLERLEPRLLDAKARQDGKYK